MSDRPVWPLPSADPGGELPFAPESYLHYLLTVVTRRREARHEEILARLGLNLARHRALAVIAILSSCTMSELAAFSAVDRTTMTRTVDQLVAAGLVTRSTPPNDRRQVVLTLTTAGRALCERALTAVDEFGRGLLEGLPKSTQRTLIGAFEALLDVLVEDEALRERLLFRGG